MAKSSRARETARWDVAPLWKDEAECRLARHTAALAEARQRPWPSVELLTIRSTPATTENEQRLNAVQAALAELAPRLVAALEAFDAKLRERDAMQPLREAAEYPWISEAVQLIRLHSAFALIEVKGSSRVPSGGRKRDPARSRAVECVRLRGSEAWSNGSGAEPWKATVRDVALLSILEGVALPDGWQRMGVAKLVETECRAVRPYLRARGKK